MKKIMGLLWISAGMINAQAQPLSPVSKFYMNAAIITKPQKPEGATGGEAGLSLVVRNKWAISFSYHDMLINPTNLPSDFNAGHSSGFALILPFDGPYLNPQVRVKFYSLTMARHIPIRKKGWLQLGGGLSHVSGEKASFTRQSVSSGSVNYWLGYEEYTTSNYTMKKENAKSMGVVLRADIQKALGRNLGLGFSVVQEISAVQSPLFMEIRFLIGHFGLPKRTKTTKTKIK